MKQMTRREFIKCTATFSATAAGIPPFSLGSLTNIVEKRGEELVVYPFLYRFVNKSFQIINTKLWGCNWDCKWCTNKFTPLKNATPAILSIGKIMAFVKSAHLKMHLPTLLLVSGGEPRINPDFIIEMMYPIKESHTDVNQYFRNVVKMGKIASQYFYRIFPDPENMDLYLPREMVQFEIKPGKLTRSWRWSKSGGELA